MQRTKSAVAIPTSNPVEVAAKAFVALGILLRVVRYLMDFPLWSDEARLAANFVHGDFDIILRPLRYQQVAPLGYLVVEMFAVKLLGFSTWSLRLFALACSLASVPLFYHVARRLLNGRAFLLAVAFFTTAWWPVKFGSEAKPYASDLIVSLGLLAIGLEWLRDPRRIGWLWGLVASSLLSVTLSFPSVFVIGGLVIALGPSAWRCRRAGAAIPFLVLAIVPAAIFAALLPAYRLTPLIWEYMERYWADAYPPRDSLPRLLGWLAQIHVGNLFAYPVGCESGGSTITAVGFFAGSYALWKSRHRSLFALLLAPLVLNLAAAVIHRYPYGDQVRTMQYYVPTICLLAGLGLSNLVDSISASAARRWVSKGLVYGSLAVGVVHLGFAWLHPFELRRDLRLREFAQRFWGEVSRDARVVCAECHLGLAVWPRQWEVGNWTNYFECYERIYSPCCRTPKADRIEPPIGSIPLRVVFFNERPEEDPISRDWIESMGKSSFVRVVRTFTLRLPERRAPDMVCRYLVYEFRARATDVTVISSTAMSAQPAEFSTYPCTEDALGLRLPAPNRPPYGDGSDPDEAMVAANGLRRRRTLAHLPGRDPWERIANH